MSWTIIFLYILAVIFLFSFIDSIFNLYGDRENGEISIIFYGILFVVTLYTAITTHKSPQAIDVYRGKTSLEITSVNNIPTDTTVVWKTY
jgi:amino acid transporter